SKPLHFRPQHSQDSKLFHFKPWGKQLLAFSRLLLFRRHHYQLLHFNLQDSKPLHFKPQHCQLLHFRARDRQLLHFRPQHRQLLHFNLQLIPHQHKQHPISVLNVSLHIIGLSME
ncbi:hypothetical protein A4A49_56482, partial [Nicotiana attenuata]